MGEFIRNLGSIELNGTKYDIELNRAASSDHSYDIHIQNAASRLCLNELDFLKLSTAVICASQRIEEYKNCDIKGKE